MNKPEKNVFNLTEGALIEETTIDEYIKSLPSDIQEAALIMCGFTFQLRDRLGKMNETDRENYIGDGSGINKEIQEQAVKIKASVAETDKIMNTEDIFNLLNMPSVSSSALMLVISRMDKIIKKNQQIAGQAKHQQSLDRWQPYKEKYDEFVNEGMKSSVALNRIAGMIESEININPETPFKKRPDRGTVRRQLVTNRK